MSTPLRICLLGFGEVGQILAADLAARGVRDIVTWDRLFPDESSAPAAAVRRSPARAAASAAAAVNSVELVISAVTAGEAVAAARSVSDGLAKEAFFLDLNSVSPAVKREAAAIVGDAGGRYVEAAVMAAVPPTRLATPMLLGGPHAAAFLPIARELGFSGAELFSHELGRASAAKMCRSVMVKGLEALLAESLLAARYYGVEEAVLASLRKLVTGDDWREQARYMLSRSLVHGRRRAEEMREVARTVEAAGIVPAMSSASAARQDWAAGYAKVAQESELERMLDAILASMEQGR